MAIALVLSSLLFSGAPPLPEPGTVTRVPSKAAGDAGIAVRVIPPMRPRYEAGAPVAIHVPGGHGPGAAAGPPEFAVLGFVEIHFAFPDVPSYDFRGERSIRALADVIRFATGRAKDAQGRPIDELAGGARILKTNAGLIGSSHGGNACGVAMALHGQEFPDLAFYVSMESPYGDGAVNAELGSRESGLNPAYDPEKGVLDLSRLAWSPDSPPAFFRPSEERARLKGAFYFDIDRDGRFDRARDFPAHAFVVDAGSGLKAYYSLRILREAENRKLNPDPRPAHIPTVAEAAEFWKYRDASSSIPAAVKNCPDLAVIVYGNDRDHVQIAPDHPHILCQVEGFRAAGARFVKLNPDRAYVERILAEGAPPLAAGKVFADEDAGKAYDRRTIIKGLEPAGLPPQLFVAAAVCELADRRQAKDRTPNLDRVLFPDAPWAMLRPPPAAGRKR